MRIGYKIFWVEDDDSWFETNRELFEDTLEEWGFKLEYSRAKSFEDVKQIIEQDGLQDFDLLLIDLKLNNNEEEYGNQVISLIRDKEVYTDIIFYSSAIDRIHEIMKSNELEGVYTSNRTNLETKFEKVVRTTIKKIQEVNTIRGLLMAETSDLDDMMLRIILTVLENGNGVLEKYVEDKMTETVSNNQKRVNSKETTITDKVQDGRIFTSFHKAKVINKICSVKKLNVEKFFENYNKDVLKTRNVFAHVKEELRNGKKVLVSTSSGNEEIFNEERCIEIRKTLIKYREQLSQIENYLKK